MLCAARQAEITDALVDLLIALVAKINARAERRVEKQRGCPRTPTEMSILTKPLLRALAAATGAPVP